MKIMYIINNVNIGGATDALVYLLQHTDNVCKKVFCKNNYLSKNKIDDIKIQIGNGLSIYNIFLVENYDLIHWFKADSSILFDELCEEMKRKNRILPVITTVCQYPREFRLKLTPNEIQYSQKIVFIDKHAYNCDYNKYIPNENKRMIYFGIYYNEIQLQKYNTEKAINSQTEIIFGRGSSLNKCHRKIIDWFNAINISNKKFCIVGIGENAEWLKKEIQKYNLENTIEIVPHLSFDKWLDKVNTFDVFLYQIPLDSYSSIDGTMQAAMLLGKPVVYYGSESPKELLVHGESGFIATNKEEFIHYATLLASNQKLRTQMGNKAKERILTEFNWHITVEKYNKLYAQVITSKLSKTVLTGKFITNYNISKYTYALRLNFVNLFPKEARKKLKRKVLNFLGK